MSALLILRVTTQSPHFDAMVSAPGPGRRRQVERQPRLARPAVLGHNVERRLGANPRLRSASSMCCRSLTAANTWRRPPHGHCSPNARCPALGSAAATRGSTRPARRRLGLQRPQALARPAPSSPPRASCATKVATSSGVGGGSATKSTPASVAAETPFGARVWKCGDSCNALPPSLFACVLVCRTDLLGCSVN